MQMLKSFLKERIYDVKKLIIIQGKKIPIDTNNKLVKNGESNRR